MATMWRRMRKGPGGLAALCLALILAAGLAADRDLVAQTGSTSCDPENPGSVCSMTQTCFLIFFCSDPEYTYWPDPKDELDDGEDDAGGTIEPDDS